MIESDWGERREREGRKDGLERNDDEEKERKRGRERDKKEVRGEKELSEEVIRREKSSYCVFDFLPHLFLSPILSFFLFLIQFLLSKLSISLPTTIYSVTITSTGKNEESEEEDLMRKKKRKKREKEKKKEWERWEKEFVVKKNRTKITFRPIACWYYDGRGIGREQESLLEEERKRTKERRKEKKCEDSSDFFPMKSSRYRTWNSNPFR